MSEWAAKSPRTHIRTIAMMAFRAVKVSTTVQNSRPAVVKK